MRKEQPKENIIYERCSGIVKFFARDKGFGFIKRPNKSDVFLGVVALEKSGIPFVKEGDLLDFDLVPVKGKGGKAINIKRITK